MNEMGVFPSCCFVVRLRGRLWCALDRSEQLWEMRLLIFEHAYEDRRRLC